MTDHLGHAIIVGTVVKLEGTVVAIDETGTHYNSVVIRPSFPAFINPNPNVTGVGVPRVNTDISGPVSPNPQKTAVYAFDGSQLTWVSG